MCFAKIEVNYRSATEPKQLLDIDNKEALDAKITQLQANEGVISYKIFTPGPKIVRQVTWAEVPSETELHSLLGRNS